MTMLSAPTPEYYGVTRVVGPTGGPVAVAHAAFKSSVLFTRPNNATAYTAGDVIGRADTVTPANAGDAIIRLAAVGPVGGAVSLETVELHFDTNAIPAGMTTFRLHLYGLSPAAVLDNAVYNLSSAEIARYLGFITLNAPVDFGDTIYSITTDIRRHINLVPYSGSLFAELETVGAFTPAALTPVTLKVSSRQLSPATQLVEDLPIANSFPALPTLNLKFSESKNLFDDVTGRQLITFTRASTATFIDSAGVLQTAATDAPRFDHNPTTGESLGLLVEEQRTNLVTNSATFQPSSAGTPASYTVDQVAPDGTTTASRQTATSPRTFLDYTGIANAQYTFSVYAKVASGTATISLVLKNATGDTVITAGSNVTLTTAWQRLTITGTTNGATTGARVEVLGPVLGAPAGTVFWGAQLEAGAFATSYIPTTAAAATRSADVASITGTNFSSWYRQDEGTVFAAWSYPVTPSSFPRIWQFTEGAAGTQNSFSISANSVNHNRFGARAQNVALFDNQQGPDATINATMRSAMALKSGSIGYVGNGATPSSNSGSMPSGIDRCYIGSVDGTLYLTGTIRRLTYWPQRLPNSTLQAITQ